MTKMLLENRTNSGVNSGGGVSRSLAMWELRAGAGQILGYLHLKSKATSARLTRAISLQCYL